MLFCPEFQSVLANQDDKTAKYVKSVSNTESLNEVQFVKKSQTIPFVLVWNVNS